MNKRWIKVGDTAVDLRPIAVIRPYGNYAIEFVDKRGNASFVTLGDIDTRDCVLRSILDKLTEED